MSMLTGQWGIKSADKHPGSYRHCARVGWWRDGESRTCHRVFSVNRASRGVSFIALRVVCEVIKANLKPVFFAVWTQARVPFGLFSSPLFSTLASHPLLAARGCGNGMGQFGRAFLHPALQLVVQPT